MGIDFQRLNKAFFFDRDGVINQSVVRNGRPYPPQTFEEFRWTPGIEEVMTTVKSLGFLLLVVTNQPDVVRGTQTQEQVDAFHRHVQVSLPVDQVYACFHDNHHQCSCRKPKPGMLFQAQTDWNLDLSQSYFLGDRWSDVDAANEAGCHSIFLDYGYDETLRSLPQTVVPSLVKLLDFLTDHFNLKHSSK